jgi:predicted transcriptional regulator
MLMYIKIPINLLHDNPFNSINECIFYAFCASHTKDEIMTFNYSTETLQEVFPVSSSQLTRYLTNLVDLGLAENKSYLLGYEGLKFSKKRNYKVDTSLYYDSFTYDENGKAKDYLNLNLGWVMLYGMSLKTALVLSFLWSSYIYLGMPNQQYLSTQNVIEMTSIKDRRTVYKALDQLIALGIITEKKSDERYFRLIEVNKDRCLCNSTHDVHETIAHVDCNILEFVKGKSKRFINSLKSYLKEASSRLGDVLWYPYSVLIGELPERFKFKPVNDWRFIE